jgi:hypothetical protein
MENKIVTTSVAILGLLGAFSAPVSAMAQEPAPPAQDLQDAFPKKPPYSPYADRRFPDRVYWATRICTPPFRWTLESSVSA